MGGPGGIESVRAGGASPGARADLLRALGLAIEALLRESEELRGTAAKLETPLRGLVSDRWPAG